MEELEQEFNQKRQFDRFVQAFIKDHSAPNQEDIDRFINEIKTLERFSLDNKRFYLLFDQSKFWPIYISENGEKESGFSVDYMLGKGLFFLFQKIHWKQLSFAYKVSQWGISFQKIVGLQVPVQTYEVWLCGIKFKDKWGQWRVFILKQKILAATNYNKPLLSFIEAEEITNLYKADFIWYKISCVFQGNRTTRTYFSNETKKDYAELLSLREIEILQLAAQQKNNREISELLEISKHTVERHRKNMIARVGVTNMTGLVRIAQIVKII